MSDAKFHMKVMIDKQKTKVLFAEIESDFADVLLSFLTMPLGSIVRVMNKHYGDNEHVLGSLTTLCKGVSDLDSVCFWSEGAKQMLLNPRSWFNEDYRNLKLSLSEPQPTRYFLCEHCCGSIINNVGIYYGTTRCSCGGTLSRQIKFPDFSKSASCSDGLLTTKTASFIISDDMRISPNMMGSVMETLSTLAITDTKDAELRNVTLGLNEIMDLLKGMFMSSTPLTDVILNNYQKGTLKIEAGKIERVTTSNSSGEMILKVMVQKSTNKLLFAQAEEDFVDFLFTLLTIPLGGVEFLLSHNTGLKSIDNFYTGLVGIDNNKYLQNTHQKSMLLNPKLPHCYLTRRQILPLTCEEVPLVYFNDYISEAVSAFSPIESNHAYEEDPDVVVSRFKSPKGDSSYVMGPRMYMVTDDLIVTPLFVSSSIIHLNRLNIPMSDVAELEFNIGLEEALSILKASLTSTTALTNGLLLLKKPVKQEK